MLRAVIALTSAPLLGAESSLSQQRPPFTDG